MARVQKHVGFSEEHFDDFKQAFSQFDKDGDGTVTADELAVVLRSIGLNPTKRELDRIIAEADTDGNNMVDLNEFLASMVRKNMAVDQEDDDDVIMTEPEIRRTFRIFDQNNNGYICASEIRRVGALYGEPISEEAANQMIGEADSDGDGRVSYNDFLKVMKS